MIKQIKYTKAITIISVIATISSLGFYYGHYKDKKAVTQESHEEVNTLNADIPDYIDKQQVIDIMIKAKNDLIDEANGRNPDDGAIKLAELQAGHEFIKDNYGEKIKTHIYEDDDIIEDEYNKLKETNPDMDDETIKDMAKNRVINSDVDTYISFLVDTIVKEVK